MTPRFALAFATLTLASCGPSPAGELAKAPTFDPKDQSKCGVVKSQAEPLIVEWPDAARGKLESQIRRGVVAVRYVGCEMQVIGQCQVPGRYTYASINPKKSRVKMRDADELYANIPAYAVKFEGTLQRAGELNVDMTIVGRYEADRTNVRASELPPDCAEATHVVTGLTVGAFEFFAGADASVGGGVSAGGAGIGAKSVASRETLNADGKEVECGKAGASDTSPPFGCGALIRLEVQPIEGAAPPVVQREAPQVEAPEATRAPGSSDRFRVGGRQITDTRTGLVWMSRPGRGDFDDAESACVDERLGVAEAPRAMRLDSGLLAQAAPLRVSPNGWRLPTSSELSGFLSALPSDLASRMGNDCYWADDDALSMVLRRNLLAQDAAPLAHICVKPSGARTARSGSASYLCVRGQ